MRSQDSARLHLALMLGLTFTTGIIDAVGYLGLDKVFTANMTGNVVILGMAITGAEGLPVLGPTLALGGFLLGAAIGGRSLSKSRTGWGRATTAALVVSASITLALGMISIFIPPVHGTVFTYILTTVLAVTMGLQAATARRLAVADITTVVVTSTLTGFAADSRIAGGTGARWQRRALAVILVLVGALVGALLVRVGVPLGLCVAGGIALILALIGHSMRETKNPSTEAAAE
ncbi:YoaK family protein [Leifsonia poae]|uniref:YoaK family protein n=1 Tax=Leifsonia poae TaxID=110933 RepID=UPI003D67BE74